MRRVMVRARTSLTAAISTAAVSVSMLAGAAAVAGAPRAAASTDGGPFCSSAQVIASAADARYEMDARAGLQRAVTLLTPLPTWQGSAAEDLVALADSLGDRFVDGTRLKDPATADLTLKQIAAVATRLVADCNDAPSAASGAADKQALLVLLVSTRQIAEASVDDVAATLGDLAPGGPGLEATAVNPPVRELSDESAQQRAQALTALRAANAVEAVEKQRAAVRLSKDALARLGVRYDGDQDGDGVPTLRELPLGASPLMKDTDGDGLTDGFEALKALPYHLPASRDSDKNGRLDPAEDVDGDGRTALQEQEDGTDPLTPDTKPGAPSAPAVGDNGVTVSVDTGRNDAVRVGVVRNETAFAAAPGMIGEPFELSTVPGSPAFGSATVTVPFDPSALHGAQPSDLRLMWFNTATGYWVPATSDQHVDPEHNVITATITHFSIYAVFDIRNWAQFWTGLTSCAKQQTPAGGSGVDVAFVLDSSGSMSTNDPANLRLSAAKSFVDALLPNDQAAVVDFDSTALLRQALTSDKAAVKRAIDLIDASGGTDIGAGVATGLAALGSTASPDRARIMILLTDGDGFYDAALTTKAASSGVTIYTIGLGTGINPVLLQQIATGTGGAYHAVNSAADLPDVFRNIGSETIDPSKDTDGDGATDCEEIDGVYGGDGHKYTSDPRLPDTDGDGVTDGEELGPRIEKSVFDPFFGFNGLFGDLSSDATVSWHHVLSDPRAVDSDSDGLADGDEADEGTNPLLRDSDADTVGDLEEWRSGTSSATSDTDGDSFSDAYELAHLEDGFNPTVKDPKTSKWSYALDFGLGAFCGTACERDTIAWLAGNMTLSAGSSAIPVFGWVIGGLADLRDAIASAIHSDWVGAGFSVAGVVPYIGDVAEVAAKFIRFVVKYPYRLMEALPILKRLPLGTADRVGIIRRSLKPGTWEALSSAFPESTLLKMADAHFDLHLAAQILEAAKHATPAAFTATDRQLAKKFLKHAADFGVTGNANPENLAKFRQALVAHLDDPGTLQIAGTYHQEAAILAINHDAGRILVLRPDGEFWSGWANMSDGQILNVLARAQL